MAYCPAELDRAYLSAVIQAQVTSQLPPTMTAAIEPASQSSDQMRCGM